MRGFSTTLLLPPTVFKHLSRRRPFGQSAGGRRLLRLQWAGRHLVTSSRRISLVLPRSLPCARRGANCRTPDSEDSRV